MSHRGKRGVKTKQAQRPPSRKPVTAMPFDDLKFQDDKLAEEQDVIVCVPFASYNFYYIFQIIIHAYM